MPKPFHALPLAEAEDEWQPFREGIEIRPLFTHPVTNYQVAMLRYRPGASAPTHRHAADEHVFIISGSQRDERGVYPAGSYVYNAAGSSHNVHSDDGCVVLIHWLAPVEFQ